MTFKLIRALAIPLVLICSGPAFGQYSCNGSYGYSYSNGYSNGYWLPRQFSAPYYGPQQFSAPYYGPQQFSAPYGYYQHNGGYNWHHHSQLSPPSSYQYFSAPRFGISIIGAGRKGG